MSETLTRVWLFVLTKTGIIRWIGNFVAAFLAAKGIVNDSMTETVSAAIVALVTGIITKAIETIKDHEVKKTQKLVDKITPETTVVEKDGLAGPETRKAILTAVSVAKNPNRKG